MSDNVAPALSHAQETAAAPYGRYFRGAAFLLLAVATAGVVVALESLGSRVQLMAVVVLSVGLPLLLVFLARPLRGMQLYFVLLPLMASGVTVAGLNPGEALTFGILALAIATSWPHRERTGAGLRELAPVLWPIAGLGLVSVASLLVNDVTDPAQIVSAFFKIVAFGLIALIVYVHADTVSRAKALLLAVVVGSLLEAAYSLGAFALGFSYSAFYDVARAAGTFSTWNHLGGFMALTSMPTLAYAYYTPRSTLRWGLLATFVAQIVTLLLTLTLGSILGLIVGGLFAGVVMFRIPLRRIAGAGAAFGFVFLLVFLANPSLQDKVGRIGERVVDRLITYAVGASMLGDRFWFGFGSQSRVADALFDPTGDYTITVFGESSVVPHASILSIGVEKGIFGIVFFVLLLLGVLRVLVRQRDRLRGTPELLIYQGLVVGMLAFMVQDMTNNLLLHARLGIIFFALLAVATALGAHARRDRAGPSPG